MPSTVIGVLESPAVIGLNTVHFSIQKVDPVTRLPFGDSLMLTTDNVGFFFITLMPSLYQLRYRNDTLLFRVAEEGKDYVFGKIVEP
jgi:hypothetical protein